MRVIGSEGAGSWQFYRPGGGVAFDGEGNLVVSDCDNDLIHHHARAPCDHDGTVRSLLICVSSSQYSAAVAAVGTRVNCVHGHRGADTCSLPHLHRAAA